MVVLVTGAAGFIGFHLSKKLLENGYQVIAVDNINDYYDTRIKTDRLSILEKYNAFNFVKASLEDECEINRVFDLYKPQRVINLAAQAGVRYSLKNPRAYINSIIVGFLNILENCRNYGVGHLIYASSSSVYVANKNMPLSVHDNVDHPVSLYAATKKSNELMAHSYSHLFGLPTTGLRFFTVYGPWGRPDMALFQFTKAIIEGKPIRVFNYGDMKRDFTYVDDIVEGIFRLLDKVPSANADWDAYNPDPGTSSAPYNVYNIGNNHPVKLNYFIKILENEINKKAIIEYEPLQPGDVPETYADIDALIEAVDFKPATSIEEGIKRFVRWYMEYYNL